MKPRSIMRIDLRPTARERFTKVPDKFGMTQVAVTSRLMEWIAGQPDGVQALVLGLPSNNLNCDAATEYLKQVARS
jgi:hypothetical protein